MARRPRRFKYERSYRCSITRHLLLKHSLNYEVVLYAQQSTIVDWFAFERLRLRLLWGLGRRRRGSRKYLFKKVKVKKQGRLGLGGRLATSLHSKLFWYGGFPHLSYSAKPRGARMGRGKGQIKCWYFFLRGGQPFVRIRYFNYWKLIYLLHQISMIIPGYVFINNNKFYINSIYI